MSLIEFIKESNRIEGINRAPTEAEITAHVEFLDHSAGTLDIAALKDFVKVVAPGKPLRDKAGRDVRVGNHIAPPGGPDIADKLCDILTEACEGGDPYEVHQAYEHLHPFMDGNGRSGRVLWLWMMNKAGMLDRAVGLGFLHNWYYASLSHHRS